MITTAKLPTIPNAIRFAKKRGFKFKPYSIGTKDCGCAVTLLALMRGCSTDVVGDEAYQFMHDLFGSTVRDAIVGGFDGCKTNPSKDVYGDMTKFVAWGGKLHLAAVEAGLRSID